MPLLCRRRLLKQDLITVSNDFFCPACVEASEITKHGDQRLDIPLPELHVVQAWNQHERCIKLAKRLKDDRCLIGFNGVDIDQQSD